MAQALPPIAEPDLSATCSGLFEDPKYAALEVDLNRPESIDKPLALAYKDWKSLIRRLAAMTGASVQGDNKMSEEYSPGFRQESRAALQALTGNQVHAFPIVTFDPVTNMRYPFPWFEPGMTTEDETALERIYPNVFGHNDLKPILGHVVSSNKAWFDALPPFVQKEMAKVRINNLVNRPYRGGV